MHSPTHETLWFRLAVRGVGILMLAWGVPSLVQGMMTSVWQVQAFGGAIPGNPVDWWWIASSMAGPGAQVVVGVYLLIGARGLIAYCTRGAIGMCPACNYDVRKVPGATCPECGTHLPGRGTPAAGAPGELA